MLSGDAASPDKDAAGVFFRSPIREPDQTLRIWRKEDQGTQREASGTPKKLWKNYWQIKVQRQQQAGEESPSAELPADGLTVAAASAYALR